MKKAESETRTVRIYHAADVHLGRRRLDGRLPDSDFAEAFRFIAEQAICAKADVFLLAGDLFDRPQVDPPHLRQAQQILQKLRDAGVPVIAIEGNHDKQFINGDPPTWIRFLAEDDLLILLRPRFCAEGVELDPWDRATRSGAWVDVAGVRFVGAGYLGAATPHKIRQVVSKMEHGRPQVLLLHAGPEYFVGEGGGFSAEDLKLIQDKVTYLALGHIHKPMVHGGWACNPGSPENCDLREAAYSMGKDGAAVARGYAVVEIDLDRPDRPASLEVQTNPRRSCLRVELDCGEFGQKTKHGTASLMTAAVEAIRAQSPDRAAVVHLVLIGALNLNRIALDPVQMAGELAQLTGVFAVSVDSTHLNLEAEGNAQVSAVSALPREEVERRAIFETLKDQPVPLPEADWYSVVDLFYNLKESVLHGRSAEDIASQIAASALVEKIYLAKDEAAFPSTEGSPNPATAVSSGLPSLG